MSGEVQGTGGTQSGGMTLGDIYFVLFRRKWIIIFFCAMAVFGAVTVCVIKPPRYRSQAELFIRYVVQGKALNPPGEDATTRSLNAQEAGILDTEAQILRSLDVAREVVDAVGPEKIMGKAGAGMNRDQAAGLVLGYLTVQPPLFGSVITITYEHRDPKVAQEVLRQVIVAYINKHKEMHQSIGIFGEFLTQETERLRGQLEDTDRKLKEAKGKAGVTSLDDAKKAYTEEKRRIRDQLFDAQAALAEHQAVLGQMTNIVSGASGGTNTELQIPAEQVNEYKNICTRLDLFSRKKQDLLTQFTEDSTPVKDVQRQIVEIEQLKKKFEADYPLVASMGSALTTPAARVSGQPGGIWVDPSTEAVQIQALKSKIDVLNSQLAQLQAEGAKVDEMEDTIRELQRKKELLEADLKYFLGSVEQSRVDEALGAGKAPNIGIIQSPSPPTKGWSKPFKKKVLMLTVGCVLSGFALAFVIELFLDRTVKRAIEVETKLRLPLFISIPDFIRNGGRGLGKPAKGVGRESLRSGDADEAETVGRGSSDKALMRPIAVWDHDHPLRRFYEGLRDRLIVYFDVRDFTQKPKLVAVTSCGKGAGVTSIAAGLAASLSETGDGNVLLVDMNAEQGASQQFYRGKPRCGLDDALAAETMKNALVKPNLYVVTERPEDDKLPRALPTRFANLMPKLKASDYDYIIFDMPPVSQTSMTPRVARVMDMVLLVIESEKTSQDTVKQATSLLAESKANVRAVLNKTRTYVPARLYQELLSDGLAQ